MAAWTLCILTKHEDHELSHLKIVLEEDFWITKILFQWKKKWNKEQINEHKGYSLRTQIIEAIIKVCSLK